MATKVSEVKFLKEKLNRSNEKRQSKLEQFQEKVKQFFDYTEYCADSVQHKVIKIINH